MRRFTQMHLDIWGLFLGLLLGLDSCTKNQAFRVKGELTGLPSDTLYLIEDEPTLRLDTIYATNGQFTYDISIDTTTMFRLMDTEGHWLPLFGKPEEEVRITQNWHTPQIKGEGENALLQEFLSSLQTAPAKQDSIVEKFIRNYPSSPLSAYLLSAYFNSPTKRGEAQALYNLLDGEIKDLHVLSGWEKKAESTEAMMNTALAYFPLRDRKGILKDWNSQEKRHTLIYFWASWDDKSKAERDSLLRYSKNISPKHLQIVQVSLDVDSVEWKQACKPDNEKWTEVCDFQAWEHVAVKQQQIKHLPFNLLIDKDRRIVGVNIAPQDLSKEIEKIQTP